MHTPGPWKAHADTGSPPFITREESSSGWICQTVTWMGPDEAKANARLIASAPVMLAALKGALGAWERLYPHLPTKIEIEDAEFREFLAVRTAIELATGLTAHGNHDVQVPAVEAKGA